MGALVKPVPRGAVALDLEEYLAVTTMSGNAALDTSHES
jgi:hypothetical protein